MEINDNIIDNVDHKNEEQLTSDTLPTDHFGNEAVDKDNETENSDSLPKTSKRQMKRQMRNKKWLDERPERRRLEKEKKKLKRQKLREEGLEITRSERKKQLIPMSESKCKVKVCIDCDFGDYMNESEIKKLVKQIGRCYAINRHSSAPVQLYITSISGKVKDIFSKCQSGFVNWDAFCLEDHWSQVFEDKSKIIYLTSESEDTVPDPKQIQKTNDNIFIIGGLVDHNRHKGLCHQLSQEKSMQSGRLPIDEHIEMTQRRVLAVNHVFEIMLIASNGSSDSWTQIFETVIPSRKLKQ